MNATAPKVFALAHRNPVHSGVLARAYFTVGEQVTIELRTANGILWGCPKTVDFAEARAEWDRHLRNGLERRDDIAAAYKGPPVPDKFGLIW